MKKFEFVVTYSDGSVERTIIDDLQSEYYEDACEEFFELWPEIYSELCSPLVRDWFFGEV